MDIFIAVISTIGAVAPIAMAAGAYLHYRFGKSVKSIADQLKHINIS